MSKPEATMARKKKKTRKYDETERRVKGELNHFWD